LKTRSRANLWLSLVLVIITAALFFPAPKVSAAGLVVKFPDPGLQAAVRQAINKPAGNIYQSDFQHVYDLDASSRNISNLTGLEYFTDLVALNLSGNQITDVTPLASLTKLPYLYLENNRISDISPLASMTGLTTIYLENNQISDISPLASLTNLESLWINNNQISDISPLLNLSKLTWLELSDNRISDISTLVAIPGLSVNISISVDKNPLSQVSLDTYIPQLESRGIYVFFISASAAPATVKTPATYFTVTPVRTQKSTSTAAGSPPWILMCVSASFAVVVLWSIIYYIAGKRNRVKKLEIPDVTELAAAAKYRTFFKGIRGIGYNGILVGLFIINAGVISTVLLGPVNVWLIAIGVFSLFIGLWTAAAPNRTALLFCVIAMLVFGGWVLVIGILNLVTAVKDIISMFHGDSLDVSGFSIGYGVVSIIWVPIWLGIIKKEVVDKLAKFKSYNTNRAPRPAEEALREYDAFWKTVVYAKHKKEGDSVRFVTTQGPNRKEVTEFGHWRGKLARPYGIFFTTSGDNFQIVAPENLEINSILPGQTPPGYRYKEILVLNNKIYGGRVDSLSLSRIKAWKDSPL
jgi:hypothetical protein